ncbi:MAG: 2-C-methyl-D-erythritol 2,4-cyclodiphosphate synthase, partial [Gammaproteobacteria bacterium]|nr:2-C-methyl-D-erythritol 2,4-cyclodiphosphate synthase [Gammaproteobacteria bacterium]
HFPDSDPGLKDVSSRDLLRRVTELLREAGYALCNIDATVIAEQPRISPHVRAMRENIAADTGLSIDAISIKATTTERMGFTGRGEGIAASAVCMVEAV